MLKFSQLTFTQQRFIEAFLTLKPEVRTNGLATLKECSDAYYEIKKTRAAGGPKIGYPNWLFKKNKESRGLYRIPIPTKTELQEYYDEVDIRRRAKLPKDAKSKTTSAVNEAVDRNQAETNSTNEDKAAFEAIIASTEEIDSFAGESISDLERSIRINGKL